MGRRLDRGYRDPIHPADGGPGAFGGNGKVWTPSSSRLLRDRPVEVTPDEAAIAEHRRDFIGVSPARVALATSFTSFALSVVDLVLVGLACVVAGAAAYAL